MLRGEIRLTDLDPARAGEEVGGSCRLRLACRRGVEAGAGAGTGALEVAQEFDSLEMAKKLVKLYEGAIRTKELEKARE